MFTPKKELKKNNKPQTILQLCGVVVTPKPTTCL